MKSPLQVFALAVLIAGGAIAAAFVLARAERKRTEELETRVVSLEAEVAALKARPAMVAPAPHEKSPGPVEVFRPDPGTAKDSADLAALRAEMDKLKKRVKQLGRDSIARLDDEVAGTTNEQLWEKYLFALQEGNPERAHELAKRFHERFPGDPHASEALLSLAMDEIRGNDWKEAKPLLDELLRDHPDSPEAGQAEFQTGMSRLAEKNAAEGIKYLEQSIPHLAVQPYWQAAATYNLANAYLEQGQTDLAKENFRKLAQYGDVADAKKMVEDAAAKLAKIESH